MFKKSYPLISVISLLTSLIFAGGSTAVAGTNGNQIGFSIKGGSVYWVVITGPNQNKVQSEFVWADAYWNNWPKGAVAVTTDGWWWTYDITLQFYSQEFGEGHCWLETLHVSDAYDTTMVEYDPETGTCTGEGGGASSLESLDALAHAYLHQEDAGNFKTIVKANSAFGCGYNFVKGLSSGSYWIPLTSLSCSKTVINAFHLIASHYNKDVYQPYQ
jgi:hypothetical protein